MNQIRGPNLERGQEKLAIKLMYDLLSDHSIRTYIDATQWLAKEDIVLTKFDSKIDGDLVLQGYNPEETQ